MKSTMREKGLEASSRSSLGKKLASWRLPLFLNAKAQPEPHNLAQVEAVCQKQTRHDLYRHNLRFQYQNRTKRFTSAVYTSSGPQLLRFSYRTVLRSINKVRPCHDLTNLFMIFTSNLRWCFQQSWCAFTFLCFSDHFYNGIWKIIYIVMVGWYALINYQSLGVNFA